MLLDEEYKVELLKKLPAYHRKFHEYKQISKALTPELEALLIVVDYILDSWFIETADEKGIAKQEKIAGIVPAIGDSLETRKFKLLLRMTEKIPYTDTTLEERLNSLCGGKENYSIVRDYTHYKISINTTLGIAGAFDLVADALITMLPNNLVLDLTNTLKAELCNLTYIGGVCNTAFSYLITHDRSFDNSLDMQMINAVGMSEGYTHKVTHDISTENSSIMSMNVGTPVAFGTTTILTHDIKTKKDVSGNSTVGTPISTAQTITIN